MASGGTIDRVDGLLGERRFEEAARLLFAAGSGETAAIAELAHWRIVGNLVRRDLAEARRLFERNVAFTLPERRRLDFYARTQQPLELRREGCILLLTSAGRSLSLDSAARAAEWILDQAGFSLQQLAATFPYLDEAELKELVQTLERMEIIFAYEPEILERKGRLLCGADA